MCPFSLPFQKLLAPQKIPTKEKCKPHKHLQKVSIDIIVNYAAQAGSVWSFPVQVSAGSAVPSA